MKDTDPLAHYDAQTGRKEPLLEHLGRVASRAQTYAECFRAPTEAYIAGILHDLGKYGPEFQKRLKGESRGVDHWSMGAWVALQTYQLHGVAAALAIQGHHIGLKEATPDSLRNLDPAKLRQAHPLGLTLSDGDVSYLVRHGITLPPREELASLYQWGENHAGAMLDVRMLFSVLADADFVETEAWANADDQGNRSYRPPGLPLSPDDALAALRHYVQALSTNSKAAPEVQELRNRLFAACLEAGGQPQGVFTLTAPTGSGKTLSMLAFALAHANKHNLRRIVTVLPYLTLIEQTAKVYREVFASFVRHDELPRYLIEDHSLSPARAGDPANGDITSLATVLAENWDAPVIITTTVQLLESLFSNRPSVCRKLHRLARSVILFDEVQTLPLDLIVPTLGTLARLVEKYGCSLVFATATQPAFSHLDQQVKKHCTLGWQPREIVPDVPSFFALPKRNKIVLPETGDTVGWEELGQRIAGEEQALCIVNLKRHAKLLFDIVKHHRSRNVFHLSTNMCPLHRQRTLDHVRRLLQQGKPCHLVSTQCVEAGVDIDFPVVFRSLGPLDAIVQAAGRCNRNGLGQTGTLYVFQPQDEGYPDSAYRQAAQVTRSLLAALNKHELDADQLALFERYYHDLYSVRGLGSTNESNSQLLKAIGRQDFEAVNRLYRVIAQDTINILVPYDRDQYLRLAAEAGQGGISYQWILAARPHAISLFRPHSPKDPLCSHLQTIPLRPRSREESEEWYIYRKEDDYDPETGLNPSGSPDVIIA